MSLNHEQITQFDESGYVSDIRVFDQAQATGYRRSFDQLEARYGAAYCASELFSPHERYPFVWEIASHPALVRCVSSLLGDDVLLLATRFFCKYGGTPAFAGWHQDSAYWQLSPPRVVSAWYAIDDSHRGNGCVRIVPGSHRRSIRDQGHTDVVGNMLSLDQHMALTPEEQKSVVDIELPSGSLSLHDGCVIHGSEPNRSKDRRCGLLCVYLPGDIRQVRDNQENERWTANCVRGTPSGTNLTITPPPFS